tara:strand:+ start:1451 stop:2263 length:813 start_codon:yes stop_codon:yes gene_type:complete
VYATATTRSTSTSRSTTTTFNTTTTFVTSTATAVRYILWGDLSDAASNDGAEWIYDTTTTASGTGPGRIRLDSTTFSHVSKIYISRSDRLGHDWYYALNQMLSTNGKIVLRNLVGGAQVSHRAFRITGGSYVNTSGEQRFEYDVTPQSGPSNLFAETSILQAKLNASTTHVYGWTPGNLVYLTSTTTEYNTSTITTTVFNTSTTTLYNTSTTTTFLTAKNTTTVYNTSTTTTFSTNKTTATFHNTTTFYNTSRSTFTASGGGGGCGRGCI